MHGQINIMYYSDYDSPSVVFVSERFCLFKIKKLLCGILVCCIVAPEAKKMKIHFN